MTIIFFSHRQMLQLQHIAPILGEDLEPDQTLEHYD